MVLFYISVHEICMISALLEIKFEARYRCCSDVNIIETAEAIGLKGKQRWFNEIM